MALRSAGGGWVLVAAIALLAACASGRAAAPAGSRPSLAPGWTLRAFQLRERGQIVLAVPPGWRATEAAEREAGTAAIRLDHPDARFSVVLTAMWNPAHSDGADVAHHFAEAGRRKALAGSVEREIPLREVSGDGVMGFWFTATDAELADREPGPDEWREMLHGAAAVGPVFLAFTLLDDGPGPHRAALLDVVRTARHEPAQRAVTTMEIEPMPDAETVPLRVPVPGKSWTVLVDLPDFRVGLHKRASGRGVLVIGIQPESEIVASVSLRPDAGARDAAGCRDADMAALAESRPGVADVRTGEGRAVARASYTVDVDAGAAGAVPQANAHAFLHRDGICANVHLSKAEPGPDDAARLEAILSSVRFGEDL